MKTYLRSFCDIIYKTKKSINPCKLNLITPQKITIRLKVLMSNKMFPSSQIKFKKKILKNKNNKKDHEFENYHFL